MTEAGHIRGALVLVAAFVASGLCLELMLGLRVPGWVDDPLRREFLRLGHAHGGILGILNLALAWALQRLATGEGWARRIRVAALGGAAFVGVGFIGGGVWHGPTDPGPLVFIVPAGAVAMLVAVVAAALVREPDGH